MSRPKSSTGSAAKKSEGTVAPSPNKSTFAANQERARQWLQQVLAAMGIPAAVRVVGEVLEIEASSLTPAQKRLLLAKAPPPCPLHLPEIPLKRRIAPPWCWMRCSTWPTPFST